MAPEDIAKAAITTPFRMFEFLRMPFGLRNSAQWFINEVFFWYWLYVHLCGRYINENKHLVHLRNVVERLSQYGLHNKPSKCVLGVSEVDFLSYKISKNGIQPSNDRVDLILNYIQPTTIEQLQNF